jgi:hypothetical protein
MQDVNPYRPPPPSSRLEETTLKKTPVLLVFFFSFITYGIYVPFWYWRRRHALNGIAPERRVDRLVILAFFLLVAIFVLPFAANVVGPVNDLAGSPLLGALAWSYVIVIMVLAFRVGRILETTYLEKVSGLGVFLLNLLYLQYKINRLRQVRSEDILSLPREDRRTATMAESSRPWVLAGGLTFACVEIAGGAYAFSVGRIQLSEQMLRAGLVVTIAMGLFGLLFGLVFSKIRRVFASLNTYAQGVVAMVLLNALLFPFTKGTGGLSAVDFAVSGVMTVWAGLLFAYSGLRFGAKR